VHEDAKHPKPVDGHFIIAIDSGEGCPGGITVNVSAMASKLNESS